MRVDLLVLFTSCALLVCASDASNVRGSNPITPSDMSTIVQPVSESQRGIPEKRLLRTNKSKINEERTPTDAFLKSVGLRLTGDKAVKQIMESIGHMESIGSPRRPSPYKFFRSTVFPEMVSHFKDRPRELMTSLRKVIHDKPLALEISRAKNSGKISEEDANALMNELSQTYAFSIVYATRPEDRIFQILMETEDTTKPYIMRTEEIKALDDFVTFRAAIETTKDSKPNKASMLITSMERGVMNHGTGQSALVSAICEHPSEPGAMLLEKALFEHLRSEDSQNKGAVKRLFDYAFMVGLKTNLLTSEQLNMLDRFNAGLPGTTFKSDASSKVKTLRNLFGNDKGVAEFLSKAEEKGTEEVKKAATELKAEFTRQRAI